MEKLSRGGWPWLLPETHICMSRLLPKIIYFWFYDKLLWLFGLCLGNIIRLQVVELSL